MSIQNTFTQIALAGCSASCGALVTNPVDVAKIRMQLDGDVAKREGVPRKYTGMISTMRSVYVGEGAKGLYKGLSASVGREMVYSGIRLGAYEFFKGLFGAKDPKNTPLYKKLAAAACTGAVGSAIANPCDLAKIRLQADTTGTRYTGFFNAINQIFRAEGVKGCYVGVMQTVQRAAVINACQAPAYDHTKHTLINNGIMKEGMPLHLVASFSAGVIAVTVTAPLDLIKTRVMSAKSGAEGGKPLYTGTVDCLVKTVKAEGPLALWAGWIPGWMRLGPHTIVTFLVFEQLRKCAGMRGI